VRRAAMSKHAESVAKFYSHGAERRAREANGFLSFGYWPEGTRDYAEATEKLLDLVIEEARIEHPRAMLNVCSGNGIETVRLYERLRPTRIHGVDITPAHVEESRRRARALGIDDKVLFHRGDATRMPFDDASFSHIVGIEGMAHMKTREQFFAEAHRLLEPGGMLVMTDSIVKPNPSGLRARAIAALCARVWYMPPENLVGLDGYRAQLERQGFRVELARAIGDRVFPGFARFNVTREAILNDIEVRGLPVGLGLAFLCWLLGEAYARGVSDYLIVKAFKR
jgi:cyclopropane fatty-acyl-phospholipid synthase-like methyltransferase